MRASPLYNQLLEPSNVAKLADHYRFRGHLGDQDFFSMIGMEHPELFYSLACGWNRQLCTWWRDHGYGDVFQLYYHCGGPVYIYHGNCNSPIPDDWSLNLKGVYNFQVRRLWLLCDFSLYKHCAAHETLPPAGQGATNGRPIQSCHKCGAHHFRLNLGVRDENSLAFKQCKELPWRGRVSSGTQEENKKYDRFGFEWRIYSFQGLGGHAVHDTK